MPLQTTLADLGIMSILPAIMPKAQILGKIAQIKVIYKIKSAKFSEKFP